MSQQYITAADITATVAQDYNMSPYISGVNQDLEYLAYSLNVGSGEISEPVHYIIREYGKALCLRELYKDKIGANNNDMATSDKYMVLFELENKEVERLRRDITQEMFIGVADTPSELTRTTVLFRG